MRRMNTRQAARLMALLAALLAFITACSPSNLSTPTLTLLTPTPSRTPPATVSPTPAATGTATPPACVSQPGIVEQATLESTKPPQDYFVYLPPCYAERTDKRYPVLYLLHGQTYTADQWIRLGAVDTVNALILNGEIMPFMIVFPDDRYWNQPSGTGFGNRLTNDLIPFIDQTYHTLPDPRYRAIGGMSRGGGWALQLGLTRPDLFSIIGLHSPAVFQRDAPKIENWIRAIAPDSRPMIYIDIGRDDRELASVLQIEAQLTQLNLPHEWHLYGGSHTEEYWSSHVEEYLIWYSEQWKHP